MAMDKTPPPTQEQPPKGLADLLPDKLLLTRHEVLRILGISQTSLYRGVAGGYYPAPIHIGPRRVGWRRSDIETLLERGIEDTFLEYPRRKDA